MFLKKPFDNYGHRPIFFFKGGTVPLTSLDPGGFSQYLHAVIVRHLCQNYAYNSSMCQYIARHGKDAFKRKGLLARVPLADICTKYELWRGHSTWKDLCDQVWLGLLSGSMTDDLQKRLSGDEWMELKIVAWLIELS